MGKTWKARTTAPELTNKYYISTEGGGYNTAIKGNSSTNKVKNRPTANYCLPNCVSYAVGRSMEIAGKKLTDLPARCNAEDWNDQSKWVHGTTPKEGAIACWKSGKNWNSSDGCGHVAVVEKVNSDGSFLVSESGWTQFYFRTHTISASKYYGSGLQFECFLYNPYAVNNYTVTEDKKTSTTTTTTKSSTDSFLPAKGYWGLNDKDARVKKIGQFMYTTFPSYTNKKAVNETFNSSLKSAIKEFQKRTSLEVDGNVGPLTLAKLRAYGFDGGTSDSTAKLLSVGDKIKIAKGAKYTNGKAIPTWVLNSTLYCREINGNVITFSTLKTGAVTGTTAKSNCSKA